MVTGDGEFSSWLISASLAANDLTYSSSVGELINETVAYTTALGSRPTNHIGYTTGNITEEDHYLFEVNMYWDQEIGVLVEMNLEAQTSIDGNVTTASAEWKLLEANNATIPEFSPPVLVATFIVVTLAVFSVKSYSPKLKKQRMHC